MKKSLAIQMFGSCAELARAVGLTRSAVHQWPDEITEPRASQIREIARARGYMKGNKVVGVVGPGVKPLETPIEV